MERHGEGEHDREKERERVLIWDRERGLRFSPTTFLHNHITKSHKTLPPPVDERVREREREGEGERERERVKECESEKQRDWRRREINERETEWGQMEREEWKDRMRHRERCLPWRAEPLVSEHHDIMTRDSQNSWVSIMTDFLVLHMGASSRAAKLNSKWVYQTKCLHQGPLPNEMETEINKEKKNYNVSTWTKFPQTNQHNHWDLHKKPNHHHWVSPWGTPNPNPTPNSTTEPLSPWGTPNSTTEPQKEFNNRALIHNEVRQRSPYSKSA